MPTVVPTLPPGVAPVGQCLSGVLACAVYCVDDVTVAHALGQCATAFGKGGIANGWL